MKKKASKLDKVVSEAFYRLGSGIQFDIFDLSKIAKAGENAGLAGQDIDKAISEAIAKYRQN